MQHFLNTYWAGRIGRAHYLVGVSAVLGFWIAFGLSASHFAAKGADESVALMFLAVSVIACLPGSRLVARRAHDLGWSATAPLVAFAIMVAPMLLALGGAGALSRAALVGIAALIVFICGLAAPAGQKAANQYGPPPAGLTPRSPGKD